MDWSAAQYLRFGDERTRAARDLLNATPNVPAQEVVDLGCGPANSTGLLAARYPGARVSGVDSSPDMLAEARRGLPSAHFELGRIEHWQPDRAYDVIFANAVLQWLPGHETLLPGLVKHLKPGGTLAVQMPDNLDEPSHRSMREVARSGAWSGRLEAADASRTSILSPASYYAVLANACTRVDVWRTVYHHPLAGPEAIVEWFKGSGLRPYLGMLDDSEKKTFLAAYLRRIEQLYPRQPDGRVLLAFPRLFIIATR